MMIDNISCDYLISYHKLYYIQSIKHYLLIILFCLCNLVIYCQILQILTQMTNFRLENTTQLNLNQIAVDFVKKENCINKKIITRKFQPYSI